MLSALGTRAASISRAKSPGDQPASGSGSRRSTWRDKAGCLRSLLGLFALTVAVSVALQVIRPWPYLVAFCVITAGLGAKVQQIQRRGQTVAEAITASKAGRRRRMETRKRAREAAALLPWLHDKRLGTGAVPGVLITPAPDIPGYHRAGYDIVLDSPGDQRRHVAKQVMRLTRVRPKIARSLLDSTPVTVLRVPDAAMADAARTMLESAGATVSINQVPG